MGCCTSNLKMDMERSLSGSVYASKRSRSSSCSSKSSKSNSNTSSGLGSSECSTPRCNRSIWSRSQTRPICDDFAEQPMPATAVGTAATAAELERSYGYHTCSSAASTPSKQDMRHTQDMEIANRSCNSNSSNNNDDDNDDSNCELSSAVGNLEWEMYMMQHAQRIMPKTSSPVCQRRDTTFDLNSRSYHKWRNYLQSTPVHMLHNVSHIPEAIAGHFCPIDFPAFSDLEEMESAAKRFKIDTNSSLYTGNNPHQRHLTHTISTDL